MKAYLKAVRIAPKKADLLAKLIRGRSVPDAMSALEHTNKKAARMLEQLLRSAIANASHNDKQDAQMMVVKTVVVNKAQTYHRGVPMARGRVRPMRKFLSHIELTLGFADEPKKGKKSATSDSSKNTSKKAETAVKKTGTSAKSTKGKSVSAKAATDTAASSSRSGASKKSSAKAS